MNSTIPIHFIFHSGHVGSTLLSRLLEEVPSQLGLREPLPLRSLAELHDRSRRDSSEAATEFFYDRLALASGAVQSVKVRSMVGVIPMLAALVLDEEMVGHSLAVARALPRLLRRSGIETRDQYRLLRQMGCRYGQGYLFAKPLPADDIGKLLRLPGRILPDPETTRSLAEPCVA